MSAALEIIGFLLSLCGWLAVGATLSNSYWKTSTIHGNVITTSSLFENLWKSCAEDSTGVSNCRQFESMLALPAYIQACRSLMIISIVLGLLATVLSLFGLRCTQAGMSNENAKVKMSVTGGAIFILAGLSSMVAVSWYAARITVQFFDPLYGGTKYELGDALYLGWAGSILSMLGGIFLTCSCKGGKRRKHSDGKYDYSAGQAVHQPRIYTKNSDVVMTSKDYV
ncbi:claudin-15-like isoform X2 [Pelodiscus sinensis]|uniref:claudin-15-like isoform X2 n=1 Tax=Pelodiscus sinensis TaxID=13735 RepID=UPI0003C42CA2|nr:claudin-15-like isoform X2 [Pelodiscus sinensis]|eukprot:XP_006125255.1 claudin-15-like isoform X2 [Pelodiscus sinensis]